MSEFERARQRAERRLGSERPILTMPKKETPKQKGRTNEIEVKLWIDGVCFEFPFKARITGNLFASQLNEKSLGPIVKKALASQFTGVE